MFVRLKQIMFVFSDMKAKNYRGLGVILLQSTLFFKINLTCIDVALKSYRRTLSLAEN